MATTPSSRLRLPLQETGDNPNAWGGVLNGLFQRVDESQGAVTVAVNANVTLTNDNYVANQARYAAVRTTGTGLAGNAPALVTIPGVDKWRIVKNDCAGDILIGTGMGLAAIVRAGRMSIVLCDGTDTFIIDPSLDQIRKAAANLDLNGYRVVGAADGSDPGDLVTKRQHTQWLTDVAGSATSASNSAAAAAASALAAKASEQGAATSAVQTGQDREAVNAALASIAGGPVASINGKTGVVFLDALDASPVRPSLDYWLTTADAIPAGEFSRLSSGYRRRASGLLESVAAGIPRIDHDAAGVNLGTLIEEARTNLLTYSEQFDNAAWLKFGTITVTPDSALAPNGTMTADRIALNAGGIYQIANMAAGTRFSGSIWLYADTPQTVTFLANDSGSATPVSITAAVTTVPQRFSVAKTTAAGSTWGSVQISGTGTVYAWGAQLEAGAFPTSYIPTTGAAATRAADSLIVPVTSEWFNAAEGAFYVEGRLPALGGAGFPGLFALDDGSGQNYLQALITDATSDTLAVQARSAGSGAPVLGGPTYVAGALIRLALTYGDGMVAASFNGGGAVTMATALPVGLSTLRIGGTAVGNNSLNGTMRRIAYVPRRLDNTTLQRMTA